LVFGKIRFQLTEGMCHYVIEDHATLIRLCHLLNGRLRTTAKLSAFNLLIHSLNLRHGVSIPFFAVNPIMNYN
jgi:hypothetical protein